jgi:hypothetical protein
VHATLVLHGAPDLLMPAQAGLSTAHGFPEAKLTGIPGVRHDVSPALTPVDLHEIRGFLQSLAGRTPRGPAAVRRRRTGPDASGGRAQPMRHRPIDGAQQQDKAHNAKRPGGDQQQGKARSQPGTDLCVASIG